MVVQVVVDDGDKGGMVLREERWKRAGFTVGKSCRDAHRSKGFNYTSQPLTATKFNVNDEDPIHPQTFSSRTSRLKYREHSRPLLHLKPPQRNRVWWVRERSRSDSQVAKRSAKLLALGFRSPKLDSRCP